MKANHLNLTEGNISRTLIAFTLPLIASNLLQSVYSIADLLIAGRTVGSTGISAINNSSQIINLITKIAIGLSVGGNILIGQYCGAEDEKGRLDSSRALFSMSMFLGIVFAAACWAASRPLLLLLKAPALTEAVIYLRICSVGFIFIWGYNGLSAMLRAMGDSSNPFRIITATSFINIFLDILMMAWMHMGVAGAALATMLSQAASFVMALCLVLKHTDLYGIRLSLPGFYRHQNASGVLDAGPEQARHNLSDEGRFMKYIDKCLKILHLGIPCALQMTIAAFSWLTVTYFINHYGVNVSAGNGISIKIKDTCQLVLTAISTGTSTMVAQNLGAALYARSRKILNRALWLSSLISIILILIVEVTAPFLAGFFSKDPAVLHAAVLNLRIEMIGQIFYALFLVYHGFMTGAGHTLLVMFSSFINCIPVRIALVILLEKHLGLSGIYLACMIAPAASVPIGMIYVRSGVWKRSLVL